LEILSEALEDRAERLRDEGAELLEQLYEGAEDRAEQEVQLEGLDWRRQRMASWAQQDAAATLTAEKAAGLRAAAMLSALEGRVGQLRSATQEGKEAFAVGLAAAVESAVPSHRGSVDPAEILQEASAVEDAAEGVEKASRLSWLAQRQAGMSEEDCDSIYSNATHATLLLRDRARDLGSEAQSLLKSLHAEVRPAGRLGVNATKRLGGGAVAALAASPPSTLESGGSGNGREGSWILILACASVAGLSAMVAGQQFYYRRPVMLQHPALG